MCRSSLRGQLSGAYSTRNPGSAVSANIANVHRDAEEVIRSCDVMADVDLDAQCGA